MKHKLLSLLLLFVLASCSSDDDKANATGDGSLFEISVNGENLSLPQSTFIANESCGNIYATVMDIPERYDTQFRMEFELTTSGHINKVMFVEFSDNNRQYETVVFNPASTFTVSNFSYESASHQLSFEFEGELYEMEHPENKKHISGKMRYNNTTAPECSIFPRHVTVDNGAMHFTRWVMATSANSVNYDYYSDNGYVMRVTSDTDLKNVAPGSYPFTTGSALRINLYKYIGTTKATYDDGIYPADWKSYTCTGTVAIDVQNQLPFPHTAGSFTLQAEDTDGNVIFEALTGTFEM